MEESTKKGNNNQKILIAIIAILVALNCVWFYLHLSDKKEIAEKAGDIIENEGLLNKARADLDSLKNELNVKILEVKKLKGDSSLLVEMRKELEIDLQKARGARKSDLEKINQLQLKITTYVTQLRERDIEIGKLREEREQFFKDNTNLKKTLVQRDDSIIRLQNNKKDLDTKIAQASVLKAENVKVVFIDTKGKERDDDSYKAKKIDKIKVSFSIGDNKIARIETKEVALRIIEPDGAAIADVNAGGGSLRSNDGQEIQYTSKQAFLFDNKQPSISFIWQRGSQMKTGQYRVEMWCEGNRIGEGSFTVK